MSIEQFKDDVISGLRQSPQKTLPSKYFYDKKGDELFVQIMHMPEYYLTNAEMDIFENKTQELIESFGMDKTIPFELIELGAGDGTKTLHLLEALVKEKYRFTYIPVDISQNALDGLQKNLTQQIPHLPILPQQGDYFKILNELHKSEAPKIILFIGSNIGNLTDDKAALFMYKLGENLTPGDKIVLGVDLMKSKEIVLPAYNDEGGITAEFNLNLLDRINTELDGDFDRKNFEHAPFYDEEEGFAKSYLKSKKNQSVSISGQHFNFKKDETICTEISRKYNDTILNRILGETDITVLHKIVDSESLFADYILVRN
jgi:L-histidine N-alpha-methyltransferase